MGRIRALDGVRALAVLAVIASHSGTRVGAAGWLGVDVFFVLSGYLITNLLLSEWDRSGRISLRRFYLRRALRLYPALVGMIIVCLPFAAYFGNQDRASGYGLTALLAITYVEDFYIWVTNDFGGSFGHTWSLSIEEQFYLVWPLALIAVLRRGRSPLGWAAGGALVSLTLLFTTSGRWAPGEVPVAYYLPHTRAFELLFGAVLAAVLRSWGEVLPRRVAGVVAGVGLVGLATVIALIDVIGVENQLGWCAFAMVAAALCSVLVVAGIVRDPGSRVATVLGWGPLAWLGLISYGVYLYHLPIMIIFGHLLPLSATVRTVAELPVIIAVSAASFYLLERPLQRRFAPLAAAVAAAGPRLGPRHAGRRPRSLRRKAGWPRPQLQPWVATFAPNGVSATSGTRAP